MGLPILLVIGLALIGMPLFACLASLGLFGLHFAGSPLAAGLEDVAQLTGEKAVSLSTIPLFTFAGYLMAESRTAQRLVRTGGAVLGSIPGGLALLNLLTCAYFTTFTGASGVTIVAIGGLMLPAMLKAGYSDKFSLGSVTAFGAVGLLFAPSLPLLVYGIIFGLTRGAGGVPGGAEFSVEKFFLYAGLGPGLVLLSILGLYCIWVGWRSKAPRQKFAIWKLMIFPLLPLAPIGLVIGLVTDKEFRSAFFGSFFELLIPLVVIVPMSFGWQPPESAALCALYVLIVEIFIYKDISPRRDLLKVTRESMTLVGAIFVKIFGATLLTAYMIYAEIPTRLFEWMAQYVHSAGTFLLVMNVVLLLVGCLMDIFSAIIVVVPLIVPAAAQFQIDPYHLGTIFLLNLEIGYLLPPAGLNLFIGAFRFRRPITELYRAVVPFILLMLLALFIVTKFPALTWVPGRTTEATVTRPVDPLADPAPPPEAPAAAPTEAPAAPTPATP